MFDCSSSQGDSTGSLGVPNRFWWVPTSLVGLGSPNWAEALQLQPGEDESSAVGAVWVSGVGLRQTPFAAVIFVGSMAALSMYKIARYSTRPCSDFLSPNLWRVELKLGLCFA